MKSGRRRGSAMVEFALASGILIPAMAGTFQFGYSYYVYDRLQAAVTNGTLYASNRTYRTLNGSTDLTKIKTAVKNMVVYGDPAPANNAVPLVKGLQTSHVVVTYTLANSVPASVKVNLNGYQINAFFKTYTFTDKPVATYPYTGRYAPEESEP